MRMQPNGHSKQLIHWIKYRNDRVLARWLGRQFALRLRTCRHFEIPEVIVPVPLHPKKFKIRGYNQSEEIARGMAEVFEVGVETNSVERIRYQESQTGRDRSARWEALAGSMRCTDPTPLEGKRVLLVDDVITTGATMSALGECLAKVERIELWVCSLIIVD